LILTSGKGLPTQPTLRSSLSDKEMPPTVSVSP
jgi:hypothetical protein